MELATKFTQWVMDRIRPYLSGVVLEVGAGIGNNVRAMLGQDRVVAAECDPDYLDVLRNAFANRRRVTVACWDITQPRPADVPLVDTVVCSNVLEHIKEDDKALRHMSSALRPGGRLVLVVPAGRRLYGSLDRVLGHHRRYDGEQLSQELRAMGFRIEASFTMNKVGVLGWWLNGRLLKRRVMGRFQIKVFNTLVPLLRVIDPVLPWSGLSLVVVGQKPAVAGLPSVPGSTQEVGS